MSLNENEPKLEDYFLSDPERDLHKAVTWGRFYEKNGCLRCNAKTNTHGGFGLCVACAESLLAPFKSPRSVSE